MLTNDDGGQSGAAPQAPLSPVFLVGTPRSGTTWLQLLLSQHPAVATSQETHLFSAYLSPWLQRWDWELEPGVTRRRVGLSQVLDEDEFLELCRTVSRRVLGRIVAESESADTERPATIMLEKSPNHVVHWRQILRVVPEARFIILHRDPRAVCASLMRASKTWAAGWAPDNALDAARYWKRHVMAGQELVAASAAPLSRGAPEPCCQVRYEDLLEDASGVLPSLFAWLGLDVSPEDCQEYVDLTRPRVLREGARENVSDEPTGRRDVGEPSDSSGTKPEVPWDLATEPSGFYREAAADAWREQLSARDIRRIETECASLMDELGYARDNAGELRPSVGVRCRDLAARIVEGAAWRARLWLRKR